MLRHQRQGVQAIASLMNRLNGHASLAEYAS